MFTKKGGVTKLKQWTESFYILDGEKMFAFESPNSNLLSHQNFSSVLVLSEMWLKCTLKISPFWNKISEYILMKVLCLKPYHCQDSALA